MNKLFPALATIVVWFCLGIMVKAADGSESRLTVDLRDGSRVVGTAVEKDFQFISALLGKIKLAVSDIRSVETTTTNTARLITAKGDSLTVSFAHETFGLHTGFGKIEVKVSALKRIAVTLPAKTGTHPSGLVALWGGEGHGNDSVSGHDAELMEISFAEGKVGQAFQLNGYSSWAKIPAERSPQLAGADGLTISVWIKPANVSSFHPILEWEVTRQKGAVQLWLGHLPQDYGLLSGNIADTEGNSHQINSPPGMIQPDQFQQVALTYDKSSGVSRLFVNGHRVAEQHIGSFTPDTSGPLFISRRPCDEPGDWTYNKYFSGLMDEISIYNRALLPEEIRTLCANENGGELPEASSHGNGSHF